MSKTVVSDIPVSTSGQGRSGLGLEVKREVIARFTKDQGLLSCTPSLSLRQHGFGLFDRRVWDTSN